MEEQISQIKKQIKHEFQKEISNDPTENVAVPKIILPDVPLPHYFTVPTRATPTPSIQPAKQSHPKQPRAGVSKPDE
jgi:hypothetical protein